MSIGILPLVIGQDVESSWDVDEIDTGTPTTTARYDAEALDVAKVGTGRQLAVLEKPD